jgi:outer membrane protein assembly factor BamB
MRFVTGIILALFSLTACAADESNDSVTTYPANPNMAEAAIFVSGDGVTRLEYDGLTPTWQNLEGIRPFEPVVADGLVVVGSPIGLFALDAENGEVLWHITSSTSLFTPTIQGRTAFIGGEDGQLRAIDLRSGKELWQKQLAGWIFSPAVVADQLVTGGGEGTLWGLAKSNGSERWRRELGEELIYHPVAGNDDPVYVSTSLGGVMAVGASNGELEWETRLTTPTTATVYGKRLFLMQFSGLISAYERYSGRKLWEFQLKGSTTFPARIFDGKVLAITDDGSSVMLDPDSGEVVVEMEEPAEPEGPPLPLEIRPKNDQLLAGGGRAREARHTP